MNTCKVDPVLEKLFCSVELGSPEQEKALLDDIQVFKRDIHSYSGICQDRVFVKCYKPKGAVGKMLSYFGNSRAHRTYRRALAVAEVTSTPQPLALVRNKNSGNVYYFTDLVQANNLLEFYHQEHSHAFEIGELLKEVGYTLARLHQRGWLHGDFKWSNILISTDQKPVKIWLIDLDAARRIKTSSNVRGRDLARFIVNAEDHHVEEDWVECFIEQYSETVGMSFREAIVMALPYLKKLRRRHDLQYGLRTHSMFSQYKGSK